MIYPQNHMVLYYVIWYSSSILGGNSQWLCVHLWNSFDLMKVFGILGNLMGLKGFL